MVEKIEGIYRCGICKSVIIGSEEEALAHESVPKDEPLPYGLVYREYTKKDVYVLIVVGESKFNLERDSVITSDFSWEFYHSHDYRQSKFYGSNQGLTLDCPYPELDGLYTGNTKEFMAGLRKGDFELLDDDQFKEFLKTCKISDGHVQKKSGMNLSELTNKLDLINV